MRISDWSSDVCPSDLITERLPPTSTVDVLVDTTRWLDLHVHFRPIAGTDARVDDLLRRVITTLFCYGCNLGPTQTARSVKGFSRRQISWLNLKRSEEHTSELQSLMRISYAVFCLKKKTQLK